MSARPAPRRRPLVLAAGLLATALGGCGDQPGPPAPLAPPAAARAAPAPRLTDTGPGARAFRAALAETQGRVRVVALVSPT